MRNINTKFKNVLRLIFSIFVVAVLLEQISNAADDKASKRKQVLNFEDELVEGAASKPELFYLMEKRNLDYKKLLKLRENFLPEMRRTSDELQRVRGGE